MSSITCGMQGDVLLAESMERLLKRGKQDTALMASFINQVWRMQSPKPVLLFICSIGDSHYP